VEEMPCSSFGRSNRGEVTIMSGVDGIYYPDVPVMAVHGGNFTA